jgi:Ca2+/H+ antiporter, TMEM165/GDT1 family
MLDWSIVVPAFFTAAVEWVEAFTIVLAVSLSIGWRAAAGAALAALAVLAAMTAATGGALGLGLGIRWLQLATGVFLLLFGIRWLAKAVARGAGLKALHDEEREFADTRAELARGDWMAGWLIAFKGVLLEGLEVWLVVVAFGLHGRAWASSTAGALAALLVVAAAGVMARAPLRRVPENAIKFTVGTMITAFGTFWSLEAVGGAATWPWGDWSLIGLAAFYALGGLAIMALLRQRPTAGAVR